LPGLGLPFSARFTLPWLLLAFQRRRVLGLSPALPLSFIFSIRLASASRILSSKPFGFIGWARGRFTRAFTSFDFRSLAPVEAPCAPSGG